MAEQPNFTQPEEKKLHPFHYPEMTLRAEASDLKAQGHHQSAADNLAAADALRALATPAPLVDADLASLRNELGIATTQCNLYRGSYRNFADNEVEFSNRLFKATDLLQPLADAGNELAAQVLDELWGDHPRLEAGSLPALLARVQLADAVRPWLSTEALPVLPADCPAEYWVCYPDETVGALYFGYRIEMDENWDEEEPYTGWMYDGGGEGLSVYNGPQPLFYKEMEPAPAAPTVKGAQPDA